jgi:hypothetical protein
MFYRFCWRMFFSLAHVGTRRLFRPVFCRHSKIAPTTPEMCRQKDSFFIISSLTVNNLPLLARCHVDTQNDPQGK